MVEKQLASKRARSCNEFHGCRFRSLSTIFAFSFIMHARFFFKGLPSIVKVARYTVQPQRHETPQKTNRQRVISGAARITVSL